MTTATATACAGTSAIPKTVINSSSNATFSPNPQVLTTRKRSACAWTFPCPIANVQRRFQVKLFVTATRKASTAPTRWPTPATWTAAAKTARLTT